MLKKLSWLFALGLILLTQITVTASWITADASDVSDVLTPMTNWAGSLLNLMVQFSSVIMVWIVLYFIFRWFKRK